MGESEDDFFIEEESEVVEAVDDISKKLPIIKDVEE
jgi:hypothetical protein